MIAEREKCLERATISDLLAGRLSTERFSSALEHVETCEHCTRLAEDETPQAEESWIIQSAKAQAFGEFDNEPECQAVVGNLIVGQMPSDVVRTTLDSSEVLLPRKSLGPYRLIRALGTGGMGIVYLAEHDRLKRQVAIKLLARDKLVRSGWLDRFNREMTAIAALEHPHVVRAMDAGDEDNWHYLVMEYLDGLDLSKVCRRVPDIPVGAVCEMIRQAALGLNAIHAAGMIHRDIKPSNLFLTQSGIVKILDLGLVLDGESPLTIDERLTTVGHLMGTLPYMAREQIEDARNVDWRVDIYSLGATLYRLLTGRPPYGSAENLAQTIHAITSTECMPIAERRNDLDTRLCQLIDRMLSPDLSRRPQSSQEVATLLIPFCDEKAPKELIRLAIACGPNVDEQPTALSQFAGPQSPLPPKSRWPMWIAIAFLPIAFVAGIFLMIATDNGTIEIKTDEPNAGVKVTQGEKIIQQLQIEQEKPATLRLHSGKYVIELTGVESDRLEISNSDVALMRNDRQVVRITRRNSIAAAQGSDHAESALSLSSKVFQGKTLSQWLNTLAREQDSETRKQAMEAVATLVETHDEKLAAARQFLVPARRLGSIIAGGRNSQNPSYEFMGDLMNSYPQLFPNAGLLAVVEELEMGSHQSTLACLFLLNIFETSTRDGIHANEYYAQLAKNADGRDLLQKLDEILKVKITNLQTRLSTLSDSVDTIANELSSAEQIAIRCRIGINRAMGKSLSIDPQFVAWAQKSLEAAVRATETNDAPGSIGGRGMQRVGSPIRNQLDGFMAVAVYDALEGTKYDIQPIVVGLFELPRLLTSKDFTRVFSQIALDRPTETALAIELLFTRARYRGSSNGGLSVILLNKDRFAMAMKTLAEHHPNPISAIISIQRGMLNPGSTYVSRDEIHSYVDHLLVRLVTETDAETDLDAIAKYAYAANAFAHHEIPADRAQEALRILFARLREDIKIVSQTSERDLHPDASDFSVAARKSVWTDSTLYYQLGQCLAKNPATAIPVLANELRLGNNQSALNCAHLSTKVLEPALTILTDKARRTYTPELDQIHLNVQNYLQTEPGKLAIKDLSVAFSIAIDRVAKNAVPQARGYDDPIQRLLAQRLLISRFLSLRIADDEILTRSIRFVFQDDFDLRFISIFAAKAELDGMESIPLEKVLSLTQWYSGHEELAPQLIGEISSVNSAAFRDFFLGHLEKVALSGDEGALRNNFHNLSYWVQPRDRKGPWHSIFRVLLKDPESRMKTELALKRIMENVQKDKDGARMLSHLKTMSELD